MPFFALVRLCSWGEDCQSPSESGPASAQFQSLSDHFTYTRPRLREHRPCTVSESRDSKELKFLEKRWLSN